MLGIDRRFTELCIYEIVASDNRTLEEALAAYNESLFSVNGTQDDGPSSLTELMSSSDVRDILKAATSQVCPGQPACSGRGTCRNSVCTCNTGINVSMVHFLKTDNRLCYCLLLLRMFLFTSILAPITHVVEYFFSANNNRTK